MTPTGGVSLVGPDGLLADTTAGSSRPAWRSS